MTRILVMTGLVPAIHESLPRKNVDARHKAGRRLMAIAIRNKSIAQTAIAEAMDLCLPEASEATVRTAMGRLGICRAPVPV